MDARSMNHATWVGDGISIASIVGAFTHSLPAIATIGAIIWYGLMIYDWVEHKLHPIPCQENKDGPTS